MKKTLILLFVLWGNSLFAQTPKDSLVMKDLRGLWRNTTTGDSLIVLFERGGADAMMLGGPVIKGFFIEFKSDTTVSISRSCSTDAVTGTFYLNPEKDKLTIFDFYLQSNKYFVFERLTKDVRTESQ